MESLKRRVISISLIMTLIITLGAMNSKAYAVTKIQTVSSLKNAKYATMDRAPRIRFDRTQKDNLLVYLTDNGLPTDIKIYKVSEKGETLIKTTSKKVEEKDIKDGSKVMIQLSKKQLFGTSNPKAGELAKIKVVARDSSKSTTDLSLNNFITATYIIKNEEKTRKDSEGKEYSTYFSINMAARWNLVKIDEKKDDSLTNYVFRIIDSNSIDGITVIDRNNNNNVVFDRAFYNARKTVDIPLSDIISNLKINDSKYFRVNLMINSEGTIRVEDTTFRFSNVKVKEETKTDTDKKEETKTDTDKKEETKTDTDKKEETKTDTDKKEETKTDTDKKEETKTDTDKKEETKTDTDKKEEAKKQAIKIALSQGIDAKNLVYGDTGTISVAYENVDQDKQNVKWNAVYKDSGKSVSSDEITLNDKGAYFIGKVDKEKTMVISATLQSNKDVKAEAEITVKPVEVNLEDQTLNYGDIVNLSDKVEIKNINADRLKNNIKYEFKQNDESTGIRLYDDSRVEYASSPAKSQITLTVNDSDNKKVLAEKTINVTGRKVELSASYNGKELAYEREVGLSTVTFPVELKNVNEDVMKKIKYYYEIADKDSKNILRIKDDILQVTAGVKDKTNVKINVIARMDILEVAKQTVTIPVYPLYKFSTDRAPTSTAEVKNNKVYISVIDGGTNITAGIQRDYGTKDGKRQYKTISSKDYASYGIEMAGDKDSKSKEVKITIDAAKYFSAFKKNYNVKNYYSTNKKPDEKEDTMRIRIVARDNGGLTSYSVIKFDMASAKKIGNFIDTPQISYNRITTDISKLTMTMNAGKGTTTELKNKLATSGKMGFATITDLNSGKILFTKTDGKDLTQTGSLNITKAKLSDNMWKIKVHVTNGSTARVEEIKIKEPVIQGVEDNSGVDKAVLEKEDKVKAVLEKEDKVKAVLEKVKEN